MLIYIGKRIVLAFLVAVAVSFISFMILNLSGDPAIALAGADASPEEIQLIREQYGLDRPILVQYVEWVGRALRGDFGESPYFNMPVKEIIGDRIGVTLLLGTCAFAFAICLAIPLGVIAAIRPNTWIDRTALTISVVGQALPNFFFGLMLIIFFGVTLQWLPISGDDTWLHFILPAVTLGYAGCIGVGLHSHRQGQGIKNAPRPVQTRLAECHYSGGFAGLCAVRVYARRRVCD
jgi:peptide/nickel transport system permease protein